MRLTGARIYLPDGGSIRPIIVEMATDEGITGLGEAAIAYGTGRTAAAGMIKDLSERIVLGRDPFRIEEVWHEMYDHSFWAKGGGAIVFAGISAIEQALWDIKGKALGLPVYEFLGGKIHDRVQVYANGWNYHCVTAYDWAKASQRPLNDGYTALKCYPLASQEPSGTLRHVSRRAVDRDAANLAFDRVAALRDAVGPDIQIMLDLSGALTTDETIRLCRRFEEFDLTWIEEPADPFDVPALQRFTEHTHFPIAAGERIYTRYGFRKLLESRAVDIVQPDVGNTGGILETKKIAAMAEAYNLRVSPHNCATTLSTAASLAVSACLSNLMNLEIYPYFRDVGGYVDVLEDPPEARIHDGYLSVSDAPGLGVTFARERVEPFLWAEVTG